MGAASIAGLVRSTRPCVPQVYAYTTPEIARHDGWTKIGYTEQNVEERIAQQAHTVDVRTQLEWHGNALYEDGSGTFRDTDFHAYLTRLGIGREPATEWFHVTGPVSKGHFLDFRENKGVIGTSESQPYTLRDEQKRAVAAAEDYARGHEGGEFLWNCKPRFGKTLSAYELMRRLDAKTVLIVTNRPAIACSWYADYERFVGTQRGYRFVSGVDALKGARACLTRKEYLAALDGPGPKRCIEFVSLQDLKGSVHFGGGFDKLGEVADITWDLLIVDEAHEGVDTYKTDVAFERIKRHFTLHLSGTPFKALANEKFPADAIFNWTYADEQQAKRDWDDPERANPYAELPQLNLFTYQLSEVALDKAQRGVQIDGQDMAYAFDLNEFFTTKTYANGTSAFVHETEVDRFLDALATQEKFPFSTPELRDEQVVGIAAGLFGEKVYESSATALDETIEEALIGGETARKDDELLEQLSSAFAAHVTEPLIEQARGYYTADLTPAHERNIERRIKADADKHLAREVGAYQIARNEIELERAAELDMAGSVTEVERINERFDAQTEDAMLDLGVRIEAARVELVTGAGETIVREAETARREAKKRSIEAGVRDHLRGFTRTIPSFLMAYGTAETTLATFEEAIPPDVFEEVTSITVEQFRFLRDGGDFTNPETGEVEHFEGQLFDPVVFDDAVREFIALRGSLANYLDADQEEDIFDYVPPQKTNQIFTPRRVVVHMVDLFEQANPGCFDDPTHTFADLYMKSGLFITEVIKRLYNSEGLRRAFPEERARLDHILEHQVFGIAPTEIIYQIATHYILGYDDEVGAGCKHNFVCADSAQMAKDGTLAAFVEKKFGEVLGEG